MDKVGEYTLTVMKKAKWYNKWLLSLFDNLIKGDILEIGAGVGNFTSLLKRYGMVTAIDVNKEYINKFQSDGVRSGFGDIEKGKYFFRRNKFDTVICLNVLEHIKNDNQALKNIYKLLKKGGKFILLVPAHNILFSEYDKLLGHYRRYNITKLELSLNKCNFKVDKIKYVNWWGALGWLVFVKLPKNTAFPNKEVGIFDFLGKFLLWPEKLFKFPFGLSVLVVAEKSSG